MLAINVQNISKKYYIKHKPGHYRSLREELTSKMQCLITRRKSSVVSSVEDFWALNDINFTINPGERVGIIGRNGAGKSTLLKILSRVTHPTSGCVQISGRVSSLLEVGTGFHPELTGRENIFLNGAILGMKTAEIYQKFDQIVDFAEIEQFLDTPVKRYSSGMYVRLAFAVAAHLEPDILIIDEVLAVGDARFQKKCLGKVESLSQTDRTVLFVSHNMNAVQRVCNRVICLDKGRVVDDGPAAKVIKNYFSNDDVEECMWSNDSQLFPNPYFQPISLSVTSNGKLLSSSASRDEDLDVQIVGYIEVVDPGLQVGYALYDEEENLLYWSVCNDTAESEWPEAPVGRVLFKSKIPKKILNEGSYRVELLVAVYYREWIVEPGKNAPAINFEIKGGLSDSPYWVIRRPGLLAPVLKWESERY